MYSKVLSQTRAFFPLRLENTHPFPIFKGLTIWLTGGEVGVVGLGVGGELGAGFLSKKIIWFLIGSAS